MVRQDAGLYIYSGLPGSGTAGATEGSETIL
nr:MAG TPA: hypothetical protein [Caudoviricetes sp.]DAP76279.1 MAG TPA: hypothetical protein [Caudoviricetes sp.]DAZ32475.1 MAG TPA: hypothetical protein [Caudoviricetes sp.]